MKENVLIIQTAFIGDVILATAIARKLNQHYPDMMIDFMVRKGNESLVQNLSFVNNVLIWDKGSKKYGSLFHLLKIVRKYRYDRVINLQRFFTSGLFTVLSKGKAIYGFNKNPLSFFFNHTVPHKNGNGKNEVERNQQLIATITDSNYSKPLLEIDDRAQMAVKPFVKGKYICIAPASVWFTKQFPVAQWQAFLAEVSPKLGIYIIGAQGDAKIAEILIKNLPDHSIVNLCGELSLIESAALMKQAVMNYVNDSAPLHLASAVNAPVRALFCSTVPEFGFGPLSNNAKVIEIERKLVCRPCGLHGKRKCPIGTFACAMEIDTHAMAKELKGLV
jgi:ADP-heptose:LPS heptosyltransferase